MYTEKKRSIVIKKNERRMIESRVYIYIYIRVCICWLLKSVIFILFYSVNIDFLPVVSISFVVIFLFS